MSDTFLTKTQVARRYEKTPRTIDRWRLDLGPASFPRPLRIGGHWLWRLAELEAWERSLVAKAAA
jgi:predicted DNA-binding transcriptional regulator AlpA